MRESIFRNEGNTCFLQSVLYLLRLTVAGVIGYCICRWLA